MKKITQKQKYKILLSIPYRLRDEEGFKNILCDFEINGYIIYSVENINKDEIELGIIGEKIKEIKYRYGDKVDIVYMSNIRDLSYAAYRVYNGSIGAFIYFMDKINYDVLIRSKNREFYEKLVGMNCLKNEILFSKLNIVFKLNNIEKDIERLIINNNYKYICEYKNVKSLVLKEENFFKIYKFGINTYEYYIEGKIKTEIIIEDEEGEVLNYKELDENNWFLIFFIIGVLRKYGMKIARQMFIPYFVYLNSKSENKKVEIFKIIIENKEMLNIDFKEKIAILSLFILMESRNSKYTSEMILKEILKDNGKNVEGYYYIVMSLLNSIREYNLPPYYEFYFDIKNIMKIILKYYKEKIGKLNIKTEKREKTILIAVDELKLMNHSGTKMALDSARQIKKSNPEYRVVVYCEENFYGCQEENFSIYSINYAPNIYSSTYRELHEKVVKEDGVEIEIYYSNNPRDYKLNRIKEFITKVIEINPEVIITTSFCSFSIDIIGEYFPTIYLSLGGPNCINEFDMEIFPHKNELIKYIQKFKNDIDESKIIDYDYVGEFKKAEKIADRKEYKIEIDDFVMISVGRNIKYEIKKVYLEEIIEFMKKNKNVKWIIVGADEIPIIDEEYKEYCGNRIVKINFHNNIGELYRICDVYLNPPRDGGGFSMAEAVVNEIPVVSLSNMASVLYTETRFTDMKEYIYELEKIYLDNNYKLEKIKLQKKIMLENSNSKNIKKIFDTIEIAKGKYNKRKMIERVNS